MIDIDKAVQAAKDFVQRLYSEEELRQLRVEEVESADDDAKWFITLGWVEPAVRKVGGSNLFPTSAEYQVSPRVYKKLIIDANTAEVESMKMRD